jgi:4-hydroxybenzoate polyprenyltransferase
MKAFLKLIRWQNLLIVALTMILMRYAVIEPIISKIYVVLTGNPGIEVPLSLKFPWYNFLILVIATLCITAGGYVINDYFDIKTDLINKGEVIVGTKIPRRQAMMWHNSLNIIGVAAGFYISWVAGYFWMGILFLVVSGLLYFYSASYKRQFLVGNLVVALLTAMVPLLVVIFEWPVLYY